MAAMATVVKATLFENIYIYYIFLHLRVSCALRQLDQQLKTLLHVMLQRNLLNRLAGDVFEEI